MGLTGVCVGCLEQPAELLSALSKEVFARWVDNITWDTVTADE